MNESSFAAPLPGLKPGTCARALRLAAMNNAASEKNTRVCWRTVDTEQDQNSTPDAGEGEIPVFFNEQLARNQHFPH